MKILFKVILCLSFLNLVACDSVYSDNPTIVSPNQQIIEHSETPTITQTFTQEPTFTETLIPTHTPTLTQTPIPWTPFKMTYKINIDGIGKLWMPVPQNWDEIGMRNIEIIDISPPPDDLYEDVQGNLIAYWYVGYRASTDYSISYNIELAPIHHEINVDLIGEYEKNDYEYKRYTQPSQLIQSSDMTVIKLASQIVGDEKNCYIQAQLIHRWVSTNIRGGGEARDVLSVLENRVGAGCGSTSSTFVALLRALGLPARILGGFEIVNYGNFSVGEYCWPKDENFGIHVWAEFYLPGYGWIQIEPGDVSGFSGINGHRVILFKGEDIELGHGYPLGTVPSFNMPQQDILTPSFPRTNTMGDTGVWLNVELMP